MLCRVDGRGILSAWFIDRLVGSLRAAILFIAIAAVLSVRHGLYYTDTHALHSHLDPAALHYLPCRSRIYLATSSPSSLLPFIPLSHPPSLSRLHAYILLSNPILLSSPFQLEPAFSLSLSGSPRFLIIVITVTTVYCLSIALPFVRLFHGASRALLASAA